MDCTYEKAERPHEAVWTCMAHHLVILVCWYRQGALLKVSFVDKVQDLLFGRPV